MDKLKIILYFCIILLLYLIFHQLNIVTKDKENNFTYKDWQVLYNLCKKKSWSQHNFVIKSYWEQETSFKNYLLKK